jgi:hypothetical protein
MKVWVVTMLGWEWNYVKGVFDSKDKAEAFTARTELDPVDSQWVIEEWTLNETEPDDDF